MDSLLAGDVELFEEPLNGVYVCNVVINYKNCGVSALKSFILTFAVMVFSHKCTKRVVIPIGYSA